MDELTDRQQADALRKQQREARTARALNVAQKTAKVGGRTMQAGGTVAQYGGKAAQYGGRGVQAVGRGIQSGGKSMMQAGGELSATGLGAIVGVPLAIAGAGVTAGGVGVQGAGKGVEVAGKGVEQGGRVARQTGRRVARGADHFKKFNFRNANSGLAVNKNGRLVRSQNNSRVLPRGLRSTFGGQQTERKEDTHSVLGSLRHKARQKMPSSLARVEEKAVDALGSLASMGTSEALKQSWIAMASTGGVSILLSLFYINLHVLMQVIVGTEFFCKLGHEWLGKKSTVSLAGSGGGGGSMSMSGGGQKIAQRILEAIGDKIGILEWMLLIILDLIVLFILIVVLAILVLIVQAITDPLGFIGQILGSIFNP